MKFPLYKKCPFCNKKLIKTFIGGSLSNSPIDFYKYACSDAYKLSSEADYAKYVRITFDHCQNFEEAANYNTNTGDYFDRSAEFKIDGFLVIYDIDDMVTIIRSDSYNSFKKPEPSITLPYLLDIDFKNVDNTLNKIKKYFLFS